MDEIKNNQKKYQIAEYKKQIILNTGIFVIFLAAYFGYVGGELDSVKAKKQALKGEIQSYENIQKKGLSYAEVLNSIPQGEKDLKELFESSGPTIYTDIFGNTSAKNYIEFLSDKEGEIQELLKDDFISQRERKLSTALPFYGQGVDDVIAVADGESPDLNQTRLTDVGYVNYVERILRSFGLVNSSPIVLGNIVAVERNTTPAPNNPLSSQIFYIPLQLQLEGRKADIVDFLHFVQKVGNISIVNRGENAQDIEFHKDAIVQKRIVGTPNTPGYNIYENMITDIGGIRFEQFIDDSVSQRGLTQTDTTSFINFIKGSASANQAFKVNLELKFFVRGIPGYKKQSYVLSVVDRFETLSKDVQQTLSQAQNRHLLRLNTEMIEVVNAIQALSVYVKNNQPKFNNFKQSAGKNEVTEDLFEQAYNANMELQIIDTILKKNQEIIQKSENIK